MGMTIAIKDFEMPQSCYNCNFCLRRRTSDYGYFGMCDLTNEEGINLYEHSRSEDCPLVEAIPKGQYEARLKADLKAILVDLQLEIEEMDSGCGWEGYRPTAQVIGLIQQKINELDG